MIEEKDLNRMRIALGITTVLGALAIYRIAWPAYQSGLLFLSRRLMAISGANGLAILLSVGALGLSFTPWQSEVLGAANAVLKALKAVGKFNLGLSALVAAGYIFLILGPFGENFKSWPVRLSAFWLTALASAVLLKASGLQKSWEELLGAALLLAGVGYKAASYLPGVTNYPFSLGWSEASRYYYASLYFSRQIYGFFVPPTVLHPSRYLLQALPFLIPNSPIWLHRLWQAMLWVGVTGMGAVTLARRLSIRDRIRRWMLISLAFLFLLIGPVYYHLLVPAILVLGFFDRRRFWRSTAVVLIASMWAGISRINWVPVPGMLAAGLYFLEEPVRGRSPWRYLSRPLLWTVAGGLTGLGSQALYAVLSGNPPEQFTSSFSSDLLWYRLLPNPTYPAGVILDLLLVACPLFFIIFGRLRGRWGDYHLIRHFGLGAVLAVLLAGGLVVSVKIGGGSNLHNLDAFLTLLLIVTAYLFFGRYQVEGQENAPFDPEDQRTITRIGLGWILVVSVYFSITTGGPLRLPPDEETQAALEKLSLNVQQTAQEGGEILFITERHLLTFNQIEGVRLVPEYEKVFLMEMAMGGNSDYLERFHQRIANQEFALIVSEPLFINYKGSEESFGEENDAWVSQVSEPLLCYYHPKTKIRDISVYLYGPRQGQDEDCSGK
jgi:hypothetical protein